MIFQISWMSVTHNTFHIDQTWLEYLLSKTREEECYTSGHSLYFSDACCCERSLFFLPLCCSMIATVWLQWLVQVSPLPTENNSRLAVWPLTSIRPPFSYRWKFCEKKLFSVVYTHLDWQHDWRLCSHVDSQQLAMDSNWHLTFTETNCLANFSPCCSQELWLCRTVTIDLNSSENRVCVCNIFLVFCSADHPKNRFISSDCFFFYRLYFCFQILHVVELLKKKRSFLVKMLKENFQI